MNKENLKLFKKLKEYILEDSYFSNNDKDCECVKLVKYRNIKYIIICLEDSRYTIYKLSKNFKLEEDL